MTFGCLWFVRKECRLTKNERAHTLIIVFSTFYKNHNSSNKYNLSLAQPKPISETYRETYIDTFLCSSKDLKTLAMYQTSGAHRNILSKSNIPSLTSGHVYTTLVTINTNLCSCLALIMLNNSLISHQFGLERRNETILLYIQISLSSIDMDVCHLPRWRREVLIIVA